MMERRGWKTRFAVVYFIEWRAFRVDSGRISCVRYGASGVW